LHPVGVLFEFEKKGTLSSIRQFTLFFDIVTHKTLFKKFVEKGYFCRIRTKNNNCSVSLETTVEEWT